MDSNFPLGCPRTSDFAVKTAPKKVTGAGNVAQLKECLHKELGSTYSTLGEVEAEESEIQVYPQLQHVQDQPGLQEPISNRRS